MFSNLHGGFIGETYFGIWDYRAIRKAAGLEGTRFHDLRHYYASVGLLLGVPPRYMSELVGHSSTVMIDRVYQHTFPDSKRQFATALSARTAALLASKP